MIIVVRDDGMRRKGRTVEEACEAFYNLYREMTRSYETRCLIDRCEHKYIKSFRYMQGTTGFTISHD